MKLQLKMKATKITKTNQKKSADGPPGGSAVCPGAPGARPGGADPSAGGRPPPPGAGGGA